MKGRWRGIVVALLVLVAAALVAWWRLPAAVRGPTMDTALQPARAASAATAQQVRERDQALRQAAGRGL